jgi:hypothetical protein
MIKVPAAYIFLCRDSTHDECLEKKLFGGQESYYKQTGEIAEGVLLFLYNFSANLLEGPFISTSKANWNIIPEAWKGKYSWQIRCQKVHEYPPLMKSEIIPILGNYRKFPQAKIEADKLEKLLQLFDKKSQMSDKEQLLRQQIPQNISCVDGHKVRSKGEKIIDDWLYEHRISHGYEPELPFTECEKNADFVVHLPGTEDVYVEYWGLNIGEYEKNKAQKIQLYKEYQLELIEVFPNEIANLATILGKRLL